MILKFFIMSRDNCAYESLNIPGGRDALLVKDE